MVDRRYLCSGVRQPLYAVPVRFGTNAPRVRPRDSLGVSRTHSALRGGCPHASVGSVRTQTRFPRLGLSVSAAAL